MRLLTRPSIRSPFLYTHKNWRHVLREATSSTSLSRQVELTTPVRLLLGCYTKENVAGFDIYKPEK